MATRYITTGRDKKWRPFEYQTKTLTPYHQRLRDAYPGSITIAVDDTHIDVFGPDSQIIAKSDWPLCNEHGVPMNHTHYRKRHKVAANA